MTGFHGSDGTIFVYPGTKSKKLERVVTRIRERLGRKVSERHSKGSAKSVNLGLIPTSKKRERASSKQDYAQDRFMPKVSDLDDFRLRSELNRLMGSEIILLDDPTWNQQFVLKQRENYNHLADQQEENLAKTEKVRMHKMRLGGFIRDVDPEQETSFNLKQLEKKPCALELQKMKKDMDIFKDDKLNAAGKELFSRLTKKNYAPPKEMSLEHLIMEPEDKILTLAESLHNMYEDSLHLIQQWRKDDMSPSERALQMAERRKRRYRHLPYEIAQLYEEETVAGLYEMAQKFVKPIIDAPVGKQRSNVRYADTVTSI